MPTSNGFANWCKRATALIGLCLMVGGAVYVVQAGVERSSSRGWRDLAEQRASAVTDLTVRMGNLESQVKTLRTQNEGLLELNLRYQQELATLRGEVAGLRAALAARR